MGGCSTSGTARAPWWPTSVAEWVTAGVSVRASLHRAPSDSRSPWRLTSSEDVQSPWIQIKSSTIYFLLQAWSARFQTKAGYCRLSALVLEVRISWVPEFKHSTLRKWYRMFTKAEIKALCLLEGEDWQRFDGILVSVTSSLYQSSERSRQCVSRLLKSRPPCRWNTSLFTLITIRLHPSRPWLLHFPLWICGLRAGPPHPEFQNQKFKTLVSSSRPPPHQMHPTPPPVQLAD